MTRSKSRTSLASFVQKVSKLVSPDPPSGTQEGRMSVSRSVAVMTPRKTPGTLSILLRILNMVMLASCDKGEGMWVIETN